MTRDPFPDSGGIRRPFVGGVPVFVQLPPPPDHVPVYPQPRRLRRLARTLALRTGFVAAVAVSLALIFGWTPW